MNKLITIFLLCFAGTSFAQSPNILSPKRGGTGVSKADTTALKAWLGGGSLDSLNIPKGAVIGGTLEVGTGNTFYVGNQAGAFGHGNSIGNQSLVVGSANNTNSGYNSFAGGHGTTVAGAASMAFGEDCYTNQNTSAAFGFRDSATGHSSFAANRQNVASGTASAAFGQGNAASGPYSMAIGQGVTSSGDGSFAGGSATTASGLYSMAIGQGVTSSGVGSFAMGTNDDGPVISSNYGSFAGGSATTASGYASFAFGDGATATGSNATALGQSLAVGTSSFAAGDAAANGVYSVALGNGNAVGISSFATGNGVAFGDFSFVAGGGTVDSAGINSKILNAGAGYVAAPDSTITLASANGTHVVGPLILNGSSVETFPDSTNKTGKFLMVQNGGGYGWNSVVASPAVPVVSWTGISKIPIVFTIIPPLVTMPTGAGTGTPVDATAEAGVALSSLEPDGTGDSLVTLTVDGVVRIGDPGSIYVGTFAPINFSELSALSFPALTTVGGGFAPNTNAALTTLSFPALTTVGGNFYPNTNAALTTLSFPALTTVDGNVDLSIANGNIDSVTLGTLKTVSGYVNISGQKLTVTSVNAILTLLASLDGTNGTTLYTGHTVDLSGGTNAAPTGAGLTAKAALIAAGNTVTTN